MPREHRGLAAGEVEAWIRAARAGDRAAVEPLLDHLRRALAPYVERTLAGRAGRVAQVDDVLQPTLLVVAERLERMPFAPDERQLLAYACRAARSRIADLARERTRWKGESAVAAWSALGASAATGEVTRADSAAHLRQLVARLPARTGEVVRLCALEGLSFVQAAERLGERPDAVRKRYTKALERLREMLEPERGG